MAEKFITSITLEKSLAVKAGLIGLDALRKNHLFKDERPDKLFMDEETEDIFGFDRVTGEMVFPFSKSPEIQIRFREETLRKLLDYLISEQHLITIESGDTGTFFTFRLHPLYGNDIIKVIYDSKGWCDNDGSCKKSSYFSPANLEKLNDGDPDWLLNHITTWDRVISLRLAKKEQAQQYKEIIEEKD